MVNLAAKPFGLNEEQIAWVENTLAGLDTDAKIGQLFFLDLPIDTTTEESIAAFDGKIPGGVIIRRNHAAKTQEKLREMQAYAGNVPLLVAGDMERGSSNVILEGTACGHQLELAAANDPDLAYKAGYMCAKECAAVGAFWNYGPVCDIDFNWRNPVTNIRTYGSDPDKVLAFAKAAARGNRDGGMIPTAKHFPGDGVDDRDQHFLTSINSLSVEEWDASYGKVYKGMIDDGLEAVMVGHIMLPAYQRYYNPDVKDEELLPASLDANLLQKLLRGKLGFNGVISTDATSMCGFTAAMQRSKAVPSAIAAGADVFLFCRNFAEDFRFMKEGLENGILTQERLNEAVTRILALKAKVNLHILKKEGKLVPPEEALSVFNDDGPKKLARTIADQSVTLVKNVRNTLPLDPKKTKRLIMVVIGDTPNYHNGRGGYAPYFVEKMQEKGFEITVWKEEDPALKRVLSGIPTEELKQKYDAVLYFVNVATNGSDSAARISWPGLRLTMPQTTSELPNIMVSIDNPYHLYDAPNMHAYINGYTSDEAVVDAIAEKLAGESPFRGVSPVDAFCGLFNARF